MVPMSATTEDGPHLPGREDQRSPFRKHKKLVECGTLHRVSY